MRRQSETYSEINKDAVFQSQGNNAVGQEALINSHIKPRRTQVSILTLFTLYNRTLYF